MTTKWYVNIGEFHDAVSADLLKVLGYETPYGNDETHTARYDNPYLRHDVNPHLAAVYAEGFRGDEAALKAIAVQESQRMAQSLETARQKVAQVELEAARERKEAAQIELQAALEKNRNGRKP